MKSNTNIILLNEKEIYQNLLKLNSQFIKYSDVILLAEIYYQIKLIKEKMKC